jgi:hypothetical protein
LNYIFFSFLDLLAAGRPLRLLGHASSLYVSKLARIIIYQILIYIESMILKMRF